MRTAVDVHVYLDDAALGNFGVGENMVCSDGYEIDEVRDLADKWFGANNWNRLTITVEPREVGHDNSKEAV